MTAVTQTTLPPVMTDTAKDMRGSNYRPNEPLIGEGESNAIQPAGFDQYSLTDEERRDYGIKDSEDIAWVRHPQYWGQVEFKDRAREYLREQPGRRVIKHKGEMVSNGDLILVVKPKEEAQRQAQRDMDAEAFVENVERGDVDGVPRWRPGAEDLKSLADDQHADNVASGLIGPTAGMDFDMIVQQYGRDKVKQEEAFYRNGGRHVDATESTVDNIAQLTERAQAAKKGKTSTGWSREAEKNAPAFMQPKKK